MISDLVIQRIIHDQKNIKRNEFKLNQEAYISWGAEKHSNCSYIANPSSAVVSPSYVQHILALSFVELHSCLSMGWSGQVIILHHHHLITSG